MKLIIVTPEGVVVDEDKISSVTVPCLAGRIGILDHHTPMLTMVTKGVIFYKKEESDKTFELNVPNGIAKVENNSLKIVLDGKIL